RRRRGPLRERRASKHLGASPRISPAIRPSTTARDRQRRRRCPPRRTCPEGRAPFAPGAPSRRAPTKKRRHDLMQQQLWFDLGEHRSVHRPRVIAYFDDSNGVSMEIHAEGVEGWRELITEIRIPRTDLIQAWERAHVR